MSYRTQLVKEVIETLETENAKLRELALVLRHCADECGDCDACPVNGARHVSHAWFGCDALHEMMRSLGLEVEESDISAGLRIEDAERTQ